MIPDKLRVTNHVQMIITRQHFDDFIYRSAHDLRGPLATIQGLVNLLKMRKDDDDVDRFVDLIDAHARKLDERLHQLVYLAQSEEQALQPEFLLDVCEIETYLRKVIEKNAFVDFLELTVTGSEKIIRDYNEVMVRSLLANAVLHVLSLKMSEASCTIEVQVQSTEKYLRISIESKGFLFDRDFATDIEDNGVHAYSELLQSSKFTYFYAAKKIAAQLKATILIQPESAKEEKIVFHIPKFITTYAA
jgi:light-regulated signal transduction histidine kinase (bacteriophytochrome)